MAANSRPTCEGEGHPVAAGRQRFSIISDGLPTQLPDIDPEETRDWVDSFDSVVRTRGRSREPFAPGQDVCPWCPVVPGARLGTR